MVEPGVGERDLLAARLQELGDPCHRLGRRVAHAHRSHPAVSADGLGYDPGRVGEVHQGGPGRDAGDDVAVAEDDRDGTQGHGATAGAGCLVTDDAALQRHLLVYGTAGVASHSDGREDVVGASKGLRHVGGHPDRAGVPEGGGQLHRQPPQRGSALPAGLEQVDAVERGRAVADDRPHQGRDAGPAPSEHGQLHVPALCALVIPAQSTAHPPDNLARPWSRPRHRARRHQVRPPPF